MSLIFIGDGFYRQSGTAMSSIYRINDDGTVSRSDWGFVQSALANGEEIHIRPATDKELVEAYKKLEQYEK